MSVNYGQGSGQQIVTCHPKGDENGGLFTVKEKEGGEMCQTGNPVKCGDVIRLEHMETSKNVHSHDVRSPLSGKSEVSGFGDDGEGDNGDDWKIECLNSATGLMVNNGEVIKGSTVI